MPKVTTKEELQKFADDIEKRVKRLEEIAETLYKGEHDELEDFFQ